MRLVGIYALADPRTGVVRYVGQSVDILKRFKYHQRCVVYATVDVWMRAQRHAGISTRLIILELCGRMRLNEREQWWIAAYGRSVGLLNHTAGGGGVLDPSPQTRWRMGTATRGKRLSPETRAKLSAAHKGRPKSPEARAKMSAAARRRTAEQNAEYAARMRKGGSWNKGQSMSPEARVCLSTALIARYKRVPQKKRTPETRAKIGAANKGKVLSTETRAKISAARRRTVKEAVTS